MGMLLGKARLDSYLHTSLLAVQMLEHLITQADLWLKSLASRASSSAQLHWLNEPAAAHEMTVGQ